MATAVLALDTRRAGLLWVACGLLMLTKEDLIPLVTGIGGYMFMTGDRRQGTALAAVSRVVRHGPTLDKMRGARSRDALAAVLMGADERDAA